jgi:hypothetical protein
MTFDLDIEKCLNVINETAFKSLIKTWIALVLVEVEDVVNIL